MRVRKSIHTPQQKRLLSLLRELRVEAGLTQTELGSRIQKDQTFISKYESGERRLDVIELYHVAEALGFPMRVVLARFEPTWIDETA